MRCVALTGGIAAGKSTVAAMLAELGASVVDADALAREVVEPGRPALAEISKRFGPGVLDGEGALDRRALAAVVFADEADRRELERITHPRIASLIDQRTRLAAEAGAGLVVAVVPLLFEVGWQPRFEGVIVVHAPEEEQLRRLMARDGVDAAAAAGRLATQLPVEEKRRRADWVIDNGGDLSETRLQVERWWAEHGRG